MHYRFAKVEDAHLLAPMNHQLIRDEGHRNSMSVRQLEERMQGWLVSDYKAVLFEIEDQPVGYALFRTEPDHIYLRQLFVLATHRRNGIARTAFAWLWVNAWPGAVRLRIDVLVGNATARKFWQSVGFQEYCVTMEALAPNGGQHFNQEDVLKHASHLKR